MNILDAINRATELVNSGLSTFESLKGEVQDASSAISETDLQAAQERLAASLQRAQTAHDQLSQAIAARLAK